MLIGLGSSLGDRRRNIALAARCLLADPGVRLLASSRLYRTRPVGGAEGAFLNAVLAVESTHAPRGLLALCKRIELRVGRHPSRAWGDRTVDLDLLLVEGVVRRGQRLRLPHPGLALRDFALEPAREVAPMLVHPTLGLPLRDLPPPTIRTGLAPVAATALSGPVAGAGVLQYSPGPSRAARAQQGSRPGPARSSSMKLFLDTANLDEIRQAHAWGIIDGVTTNPSLVAREGGDFVETVHQICEIVQGPVSAETVSKDWEGMVREGRLLARVSEHVVVKIPMTMDGIRATRVLADDGIDVNVTLCFQPAQALLAAKAGAAYISPFMGRLDDISTEGVQLIETIVAMYANYPELGTEVLAASIRSPLHVAQVALAGADVATLPFAALKKLVDHPLTDIGLERFLADWATVPDNDVAGQVERWLAKNEGR